MYKVAGRDGGAGRGGAQVVYGVPVRGNRDEIRAEAEVGPAGRAIRQRRAGEPDAVAADAESMAFVE